jgi:hypothetical protein
VLIKRSEEGTSEATKNSTFTVKGDASDIRKEIKMLIAFEIKMPYIIRVNHQ